MFIEGRYNGPPGTGNGGYTCGLVASLLPGPAEVTLRQPPPLDTELTVERDAGRVRVWHGSDLVAEAEPAQADDVVEPVPFAEAVEVSRSYRGFVSHPFPTCFVCGPKRPGQDGLRLFPGRLGDGRVAAPFVVPADISPELMWAALDCPGGWAVPHMGGGPEGPGGGNIGARPYVLGRLAVRCDGLPAPGEECVVMGELVGEQGRKAYARTTVYSATGTVLATGRATWIAIG
jgi:hypothetical protein